LKKLIPGSGWVSGIVFWVALAGIMAAVGATTGVILGFFESLFEVEPITRFTDFLLMISFIYGASPPM